MNPIRKNTLKLVAVLTAFACVFVAGTVFASVKAEATLPHETSLRTELHSWTSPVLPQVAGAIVDPSLLAQVGGDAGPVDVYGYKRKSPTRAFLQSFLIPGWGQVYAKSSFWKPVMFLGIEAAGWAGYVSFRGKGNDKQDEYQLFADSHWNGDDYLDGLEAVFYRSTIDRPEDMRYLDTLEFTYYNAENQTAEKSFSHHAFFKQGDVKVPKDEYYENVGKYDQFNFGWDDYDSTLVTKFGSADYDGIPVVESRDYTTTDSAKYDTKSPNRQTYLKMRDKANTEFNKANTMLVATVANHLFSAFWAALDARAYNRAQDQFSRVEPRVILVKSPADPTKLMPQLWLSYRFK